VGQLQVVEDVEGGALGVGEGLGVAHGGSKTSGQQKTHPCRHMRAGNLTLLHR
jgi:hypothetical protein